MKINATQLRAYLDAGGTFCPFCRSPQIEGGPVEIDPHGAMQPMSCLSCNRTWHDIHQRVDIVIDEPGEDS